MTIVIRANLLLLTLLLGWTSSTIHAQAPATNDVAVLSKLAADALEALGNKDAAFFNEHMLLDGQLASIREGADGASVRFEANRDFVAGLADGDDVLLERMWEPTVMVKGRIGIVWTP